MLDLYAEAEEQLRYTDVIQYKGRPRVTLQERGRVPYRIEYDPSWENPHALFSALVHELLHVSADRKYDKGGQEGPPWLNLDLSKGITLGQMSDFTNPQYWVLDGNLEAAEKIAEEDQAVADVKEYLLNRIAYARGMPDSHYDTVLAEILTYLDLKEITGGRFVKYTRRLMEEANDRRLNKPQSGVKRARKVDPEDKAHASWTCWPF